MGRTNDILDTFLIFACVSSDGDNWEIVHLVIRSRDWTIVFFSQYTLISLPRIALKTNGVCRVCLWQDLAIRNLLWTWVELWTG